MAIADRFVTETREDIVRILALMEQAQAVAARRVQQTLKLGGMDIINAYDWAGSEVGKAQFTQALLALQDDFPDILGTAGEALYRVQIGLG